MQRKFTFTSQGHVITIECPLYCKESVFYDGIEVAGGWSLTGGTYSFVVDEDDGAARYVIAIKTGGTFGLEVNLQAHRNGHLVFDSDRHVVEQPRMVTHNPNAKDCEELGLRPGASWADIQTAYRDAMKVYHPDTLASKNLSPELIKLSARKLQSIRAAYERLKKSR